MSNDHNNQDVIKELEFDEAFEPVRIALKMICDDRNRLLKENRELKETIKNLKWQRTNRRIGNQ